MATSTTTAAAATFNSGTTAVTTTSAEQAAEETATRSLAASVARIAAIANGSRTANRAANHASASNPFFNRHARNNGSLALVRNLFHYVAGVGFLASLLFANISAYLAGHLPGNTLVGAALDGARTHFTNPFANSNRAANRYPVGAPALDATRSRRRWARIAARVMAAAPFQVVHHGFERCRHLAINPVAFVHFLAAHFSDGFGGVMRLHYRLGGPNRNSLMNGASYVFVDRLANIVADSAGFRDRLTNAFVSGVGFFLADFFVGNPFDLVGFRNALNRLHHAGICTTAGRCGLLAAMSARLAGESHTCKQKGNTNWYQFHAFSSLG